MEKIAHICKSNQANPDLLIMLRKDLERKGYEYKEYKGGHYPTFIEGVFEKQPVTFVISHPECFADGLDRINLGRGIFGEAHTAMINNCKIIGVTEKGYHIVKTVKQYSEKEIQKPNSWQMRYGYLQLEEPADNKDDLSIKSDL